MPGSAAEQAVRAAFAEQAAWCGSLGSPLTAQVCALMAEQEWSRCAVSERLRNWPGDPRPAADAVPLRLCGGLHAAVRSGQADALAGCYPPHPLPPGGRMWSKLAPALKLSSLEAWLERPPQTNEVGRSAALVAGLLVFATRFGSSIELFELGASAGLNLNLDRFRFELGGVHIGDAAARVQITPEWHGAPPPRSGLIIAARAGVDQSPLDPVADGERLLAFVWADQIERLRLLEAALELAAVHPVVVERADAAPWIERQLARPQPNGIGRIIMHSIAFQYFSLETQSRVTAAIEQAGALATEQRPLGWLRFETDGPARPGRGREAYLRLRQWPDGEDQLLAICHPHGSSISWCAAPAH